MMPKVRALADDETDLGGGGGGGGDDVGVVGTGVGGVRRPREVVAGTTPGGPSSTASPLAHEGRRRLRHLQDEDQECHRQRYHCVDEGRESFQSVLFL